MYTPAHFAEADLSKLQAAIEAYSFATLVSKQDGALTASHLPLLLKRDGGAPSNYGTLVGHMAKANPQWEQAAGQEVLAIFAGPHAYISPTWYEEEKVVPTWNYVAVHACGRLELVPDSTQKLDILQQTVSIYERNMPVPWTMSQPGEFLTRLVDQIVAFQIPLGRLEGKWKLNQNHPLARRQRVIAALKTCQDEAAWEIAGLMEERLVVINTHANRSRRQPGSNR
ncbi:MAG: FMN-binding negative transcriptional regulator, partial [Pirellulaceae bacterium]|nr:FMN-binding negative transcriptional regulator [Pirellulaceae bacterium]